MTLVKLFSIILLLTLIAMIICLRESFHEDKYFLALAALFLILAVFFGILIIIFVNLSL